MAYFSYGTSNFNEKTKLFNFFNTYIKKEKKYAVMISGGSDSMFLATMLYDWYFTTGQDMSTLDFITIDHGTHTETDKITAMIMKHLPGINHKILVYTGEKKDENNLRKARRDLVSSYQDIFTGHNLSDRLETTVLHLHRGSYWPGIINMTEIDKTIINCKKTVKIYRPLLHIHKKKIKSLCDTYNIPYWEDPTNTIISTSKRNHIRQLVGKKKIDRKKIDNLFMNREKKYTKKEIGIERLKGHPDRDIELYGRLEEKITKEEDIYNLFSTLGCGHGLSRHTVKEFTDFLQLSQDGWKYIQGWYICHGHGRIYIFYAPKHLGKAFWTYQSLKQRYPKKDFIQEGEKIDGKNGLPLLKDLKIPIFRRSVLPYKDKNTTTRKLPKISNEFDKTPCYKYT